MLIQNSHSLADRNLDAYFSPPEAAVALIAVELQYLPLSLWEPAAGNGALVKPLLDAGYVVHATDIADYGSPLVIPYIDYFYAERPPDTCGIVTNPPYRLAAAFLECSLRYYEYIALLLRTNFLESVGRLELFRRRPPSRIWISSRRLPMMHRHNWNGPIAPSNTCHAWFVWTGGGGPTTIGWFDWKEIIDTKPTQRLPNTPGTDRRL